MKNILRKLDTCSLEIKDLKSYYQTISNLKIYRNVALANSIYNLIILYI